MINQSISPKDLKNNHNCASLIAERVLQKFGFDDPKVEVKPIEGFGVGMGVGSLCGALSGAMYALNRIMEKHGADRTLIDDEVERFKDKFMQRYGSFECRNIVLDVMENEDQPMQQDPNQLQFCSDLLNNSQVDIEEMIHYIEAVSNPIMQRFSNI